MIKTIESYNKVKFQLQDGISLEKVFAFTLVANANIEIHNSDNHRTTIEVVNQSILPLFIESSASPDQKASLKISNINSRMSSKINKSTFFQKRINRISIKICTSNLSLLCTNCNNMVNTFVDKVITFGSNQRICRANDISLVQPESFILYQKCENLSISRDQQETTKNVNYSSRKTLSDGIIHDLQNFLEQNSIINV